MPKVIFVSPAGIKHAVEAKSGVSVMEAAVANNVIGIEAQCYGACNCGTCHVYVDAAWIGHVGERSFWEGEVLDTLPLARGDSRLSCQILMRDELDGLTVHLPEYQGEGQNQR